eukprot:g7341.t1
MKPSCLVVYFVIVHASSADTCTVQPARAGSCLNENIAAPGYQGSCPVAGGPCNRCLEYFVGGAYNTRVTREGCACLCHKSGYPLAGVENGNNCYCGTRASGPFCGGVASSGCRAACTGNSSQAACGGPNKIEMLAFDCPSACVVPGPAPAPPTRFAPRVHYTPPCYLSAPPHDIAAAIWDERAGWWHVFAGCWRDGGWQHLISRDLLAWTPLGKPSAFAGTGGLVFDDADGGGDRGGGAGGNAGGGAGARQLVAYAGTLNTWVGSGPNFTAWAPQGQQYKGTGNDPVLWQDVRDGRWYSATAAKAGHGLEDYWTSPAHVAAGWYSLAGAQTFFYAVTCWVEDQ